MQQLPPTIKVRTICPFCPSHADIEMPSDAFRAWRAGSVLSEAWPEGTPDQRERLISGTCPECWDRVFGETP